MLPSGQHCVPQQVVVPMQNTLGSHGGGPQTPSLHAWPSEQARPHAPQFFTSFPLFTHVLPQHSQSQIPHSPPPAPAEPAPPPAPLSPAVPPLPEAPPVAAPPLPLAPLVPLVVPPLAVPPAPLVVPPFPPFAVPPAPLVVPPFPPVAVPPAPLVVPPFPPLADSPPMPSSDELPPDDDELSPHAAAKSASSPLEAVAANLTIARVGIASKVCAPDRSPASDFLTADSTSVLANLPQSGLRLARARRACLALSC
jgi:hypothetical protein